MDALEISPRESALAQVALVANSLLTERFRTAGQLGLQFNGRRDVYEAAGYDKLIQPEQYQARYDRQDIAARVVDAPADEAWRLAPEILDGREVKSAKADSEFSQAWQQVAHGGQLREDGDTSTGLMHYIHRLDRLAGVGRYGVLLLGVKDGLGLEQPLKRGAAKGSNDLLYAAVYSECFANIERLNSDRRSARYGLPEFYQLTTTTGSMEGQVGTLRRVHWTRVIHFADSLQSDDIYGTPRMMGVWNRLIDLEKIMAGSGEAAWKLLDPGTVFTTRDGGKLPTKSSDIAAIEDQIDEMLHGLRRYLLAENLEGLPLGGSVTDPSGLVKINVALIAARTGIPQRILLGTEEGKLAGSQDERGWARSIETRQQNVCWPLLLRPLINRLIWAGVLPKPSSGEFCAKWTPLLDADRKAGAETASQAANALIAIGAEVTPRAFVETYLPELPAGAVTKKSPESPVLSPESPVAGGEVAGVEGEAGNGGDKKIEDKKIEEAPVGNQQQGGDDAQPGVPFRPADDVWAAYP